MGPIVHLLKNNTFAVSPSLPLLFFQPTVDHFLNSSICHERLTNDPPGISGLLYWLLHHRKSTNANCYNHFFDLSHYKVMNAWKLSNTSVFSCGCAGHSAGLFIPETQPSASTLRHASFSVSCCHLLAIQPSTVWPSVLQIVFFLALFNLKINECQLAHMLLPLIFKYSFKVQCQSWKYLQSDLMSSTWEVLFLPVAVFTPVTFTECVGVVGVLAKSHCKPTPAPRWACSTSKGDD